MIQPNSIPAKGSHVSVEGVGEVFTVHDALTGRMFVTNSTGKRVLELCDGTSDLAGITRKVEEEFAGTVSASVQDDVIAFFQAAHAKGVISWMR